MRTVALTGFVVLVLFAGSAAASVDRSPRQLQLSSLSARQLGARRASAATTLTFYRRHHWMLASRHATCWSRVPWARTCNVARLELRARRAEVARIDRLLAALERRQLLAGTSTYLGAVAYVERYFGPQWFLRSCPNGEGGFGRWVPNASGSGAGGWLQFMSGTFYGIIDRAIAAARGRGMVVPASARSWYSPLGQALAGRAMFEAGRRGEWTGANC